MEGTMSVRSANGWSAGVAIILAIVLATVLASLVTPVVGTVISVAGAEEGVRFRALDVVLDAGSRSLAAYQVEISASSPEARVVGVEGGETESYRKAPYYDPAALEGGRIVLGAFTVAADPPRGRTRVARIHVMEPSGAEPEYAARVVAAAAPGGEKIEAKLELIPTGGTR